MRPVSSASTQLTGRLMHKLALGLYISLLLIGCLLAQSTMRNIPVGSGAPMPPPGISWAEWHSADCITFVGSVCGFPADGTTLTSGTNAWADRSGNANNLKYIGGTCTLHTNQLSGHPAVTFPTTTTCHLEWSLNTLGWATTGVTVFIVVKPSTGVRSTYISGPEPSGINTSIAYGTSNSGSRLNNIDQTGVVFTGSGTATIDGGWHQLNFTLAKASIGGFPAFRVDRATDTLISGTTINGAIWLQNETEVGIYDCCGFANPMDGQIAEILIAASVLGSTDITGTENYLKLKYPALP